MSDDPTRAASAAVPDDPGPADRLAAHARIARLADDLLPVLVAKLVASGLGELEVREEGWRIRLRMPPGPRSLPGTASRRPARVGGGLPGAPARPVPDQASPSAETAGADLEGAAEGGGGAGRPAPGSGPGDREAARVAATAPAVGFYQPRTGLVPGTRVRAGERIGIVDVLGVPQEILAPEDGVVGAALVEPGEPVEYGQEVVMVERLPVAPAAAAQGGQPAAAEVAP